MTTVKIFYNSDKSVLWSDPKSEAVEQIIKRIIEKKLLIDDVSVAFVSSFMKVSATDTDEETILLELFVDSSKNTFAHIYKEFANELLEAVKKELLGYDAKKKYFLHLLLSTGNNTLSCSLVPPNE